MVENERPLAYQKFAHTSLGKSKRFFAKGSLGFGKILVTLGIPHGRQLGAELGLVLGLVNSQFTARKMGYLICDNKPLVHVFIFFF